MNSSAGSKIPVWFLMGPTASGKTDLASVLAEAFPFEIISVDAALVYRGMDVGTAKPDRALLAAAPHHLIDIRQPEDTYSAADFCRDATGLIEAIHGRGNYPLLVGGTMFYFHALEHGLPDFPGAQPGLRRALARRGIDEGWDKLYSELRRLDPLRAAQIRPTDAQRIQRALEIVMMTGCSSTSGRQRARQHGAHGHFQVCKLALAPVDRAWLHRRIEQRFTKMLEAGLIDEVQQLLDSRGLAPELPSLRMVGYRQVVRFILGELGYSTDEAVSKTTTDVAQKPAGGNLGRLCVTQFTRYGIHLFKSQNGDSGPIIGDRTALNNCV